MSYKYKTAEQHFLAQIVIRIVQLHLERRRNETWIRLQRSAASRLALESTNESIKNRISFLSDTFSTHCDLPLHKAAFNHDSRNNMD